MKPCRIALALVAALAGCNLAPVYERPAAPMPMSLPQGPDYPVLADGSTMIADIGWRAFFTEPALREVIELALANNRDLRIALANVERARAQYGVQRSFLLPSISADAGLDAGRSGLGGGDDGEGNDSGVQRRYSATVGLAAFELDLFGRLRNLSAAAQEQYLATEAAQQTTRISLIAEVASAYVTLAAAREQLSITRQALDSRLRVLELTRARQRAGIASGLDTRQADTSYQQVRADVAQFTADAAQTLNALRVLVGSDVPDALLPANLAQQPLTLPSLPVGLDSSVLLSRPDVRAAEHDLIAQHANIGAARAAFFPRLSLTAALGTVSGSLSDLTGSGTRTWSFAPVVSLPLFDGGANRNNLDLAQAGRAAAVANYERTIQTAFREVSDALARRGSIDEQVQAQRDLTRSAGEALNIAEARYRVGTDTFLNVLSSQQTLQAAEVDRVAASATRESNMIELYRALGGGLLDTNEAATATR